MKTTTKIDLHLHTRGSDGTGTAEEIVATALANKLDGICITDHHKTQTAEGLKVAELARAKGLLVFRGCEYSTAQGHLLVYGVDVAELNLGYYPEMQTVIAAVNKAGGVAIPAHPYKGYKRSLGDAVKTVKGVPAYETANGQVAASCSRLNALAVEAAKATRHRTTGGSDAHYSRNVGICYTEFQSLVRTEKDFLRALRHGKYQAATDTERVKANPLKADYAELELRVLAGLDTQPGKRQAAKHGKAAKNTSTGRRFTEPDWAEFPGSIFNR
jgi:predicted metal-dependent phosphoesterase TrpH